MIRTLILLAALMCVTAAASAQNEATPRHRKILGFVERVTLDAIGFPIKARLDTGAKTSSLHSVDVEEFERDGERWVRFSFPLVPPYEDSESASYIELERPVDRVTLIKRKGASPQRRYVVTLPFCLDGERYETEFSLTDRSGFNYPVLLGRNFLADTALVDSANAFLASNACSTKPPSEFAENTAAAPASEQPNGE